MNNREPVSLLDEIAALTRWLALLGMALAAAAGGWGTPPLMTIFFIAALLASAGSLVGMLNLDLPARRSLYLITDLSVVAVLFYFGGGLAGSLAWAGVLPLMTAAVYFGLKGAILAAGLAAILLGGVELAFNNLLPVLVYTGASFLLYLSVGVVLGMLSGAIQRRSSQAARTDGAARRETGHINGERSRAVYKLIFALNESLNYQRVLDTAMDLGYSTLATYGKPDERMVSCVLLYARNEAGGTVLRVGSARRFTSADMRIELPGTSGFLGQVIDERRTLHTHGISGDPELGRIIALRTCRSAYGIPLSTGLDTYGALLFAHPEENYFTQERREVLDIIGSQAGVALQNASLYRDLELEKERMAEIQEEARKKLARDLHDGPTQSVAALAMRANFARRLMERDVKAAGEELFKIEDLARRTTKEIRHMLFTLRPLILESQGLVAALGSMAEKMSETYNQKVIIEADDEVVANLEIGKQGVIFYIAEEAINNARKHAKAEHIWARLKPAGEDIVLLEVQDDGQGFDMQAVQSNYEGRGSLGMVNMRERAELVNGVLHLDSALGRGTVVKVFIPLSEKAAEKMRRGL